MSADLEVEVPIIRPKWLNITEQPVVKALISSSLDMAIGALSDGTLRLARLSTGETLQTIAAHGMGIVNAAISTDGKFLATTGEDNKLKVFDLSSQAVVFEWKNKGWIDNVLWTGENLYFSGSKNLYKWSLNTTEVKTIETWSHTISALSLKNEFELGAVGYSRFSVYDLETDRESKRYDWKGQLDSLAFSPKERFAVCASNDLTIHIWDLKKDKDLTMRGFTSKIRDMSFRRDGLYMANTSGPEVIVWDYMDPGPANKRPQVLGPFEKPSSQARYQHQGKMLATCGEDGVVLFWRPDLFDDKPIAIAGIRDQSINCAEWTHDDQFLLTGLQTGYMALYPVPEVREGT